MTFDPDRIGLDQIIEKIVDLGFRVVLAEREMPVTGMSCANCAANIERTLNKDLTGVIKASVNFASERLFVSYLPSEIALEGIVTRVKELGFDLIVAEEGMDEADVEEIARNREIQDQRQKFLVGAAFALPLFLLSMSRDFGLVGTWSHGAWVNWVFLALATPVQFYTGWDYYTGAYKSLKNKIT